MMKRLSASLLTLVALIGSATGFAVAQTADDRNAPAQSPTPQQQSGGAGKPEAVGQAQALHTLKKKKHFPGRGAIVAAPLPIVSPALGTGVVPILGYIFPISKNDKLSPPSVIGAGGLITDDGSRGFGLYSDLYFKEDRYETTALYGHGNIDYNLYGIGRPAGDAGLKLPLDQTGQVFRAEFLRVIKWKFFIGGRFWTGDSLVTLRPTTSTELPPIPPDIGLHTTLRALGIRMIRDTRPNQFYPTAGMKLEFTSDFFAKDLGSKYSFQAYRITFNKYTSLSKNQVLAYNLFGCFTGGQPPFYGNCIYGTQSELRGYTAGQYIDRHMFATQLEYRLSLPKRIGLAGFAGVGEVVPGASQFFRVDNFLPAVGGGPRFDLSTKYHVNLRADFARGKNSWTWAMSVGEAF
jgi:Omp85 superfamily domain